MMRVEYVLRGNKLSMLKKGVKCLITDESGVATLIAIGYGVIDIGLIFFGNCSGQTMKTLSLVYRWCWGGIC